MEKEFKTYLLDQNLSKNTITSYLYALRQFEEKYDKLTKQNLRDYKVYLIENYKPQTVNLRIRPEIWQANESSSCCCCRNVTGSHR